MLVLTRHEGDEIEIGEGEQKVRIVVMKITGKKTVKLAIKAPRTTKIIRKEIADKEQP